MSRIQDEADKTMSAFRKDFLQIMPEVEKHGMPLRVDFLETGRKWSFGDRYTLLVKNKDTI